MRGGGTGRVVFVVVAFASTLAIGFPAGAAPDPNRPTVDADAPDPEVLVAEGAHWLFTTQVGLRSVPVRRSTDLRTWEQPTDALPTIGSWAEWGWTWSPGVHRFGSTYVLFYSALDRASGVHCIGRAAATAPGGPYVDTAGRPFLCQPDLGGSIDADVAVAADGSAWLVWKSDGNAIGVPSTIWSAPLQADGGAVVAAPSPLLTSGPGDDGIVENPTLVQDGATWRLVVSVGRWWTSEYRLERASCHRPDGPCVRDGRPWLSSTSGLVGAGGGALFLGADGAWRLAVHAWRGGVGYETGGFRATWIDVVQPGAAEIWARPLVLHWYLAATAGPGAPVQAYAYGDSGGRPLGCDGDGDGRDTSWVVASGSWHQRNLPGGGPPDASFAYGAPGYVELCGDWDGDGDDTVGVYVGGSWYLRNSPGPGPAEVAFAYGTSGYVPVVGDWDGDGDDTVGVYVGGSWYLRNSPGPGPAQVAFAYGASGYVPVVGDWDDDGLDEVGVVVVARS